MTESWPVARTGWGVAWGSAMLLLSLFLGGAGHGIFFPLGVFCAPVSLLGLEAAWHGCIPFAGLLAACCHRREFPLLLAVHYLAVFAAPTLTDWTDWDRLSRRPFSFSLLTTFAVALYLGGHAWLWRAWFVSNLRRQAGC